MAKNAGTNKSNWYLKWWFWASIIVIFPMVIQVVYLVLNNFFLTSTKFSYSGSLWPSGDALGFSGSIIGGFITMIALVITIKDQNEKSKKAREMERRKKRIDKLDAEMNVLLSVMNPNLIFKVTMDFSPTNSYKIDSIMLDMKTMSQKIHHFMYDDERQVGKDFIRAIDFTIGSIESVADKLGKQYRLLKEREPLPILRKLRDAKAQNQEFDDENDDVERSIRELQNINPERISETLFPLRRELVRILEEDYLPLFKIKREFIDCLSYMSENSVYSKELIP